MYKILQKNINHTILHNNKPQSSYIYNCIINSDSLVSCNIHCKNNKTYNKTYFEYMYPSNFNLFTSNYIINKKYRLLTEYLLDDDIACYTYLL